MIAPLRKIIFIFLSILTCCASEQRVKFTGYATHRFRPQTEQDRDMLNIIHDRNPGVIFLRQVGPLNAPVDILFPPHLQTDLLKTLTKKMPSEPVSEDIESLINHEESILQLEAMPAGQFTFENYWNLNKVHEFYRHLQSTHSDLCTIEEYGESYEGRKLTAMVVSDKATLTADKPVFVLEAGAHAREWITVMSCCYFLNEVVTSDKPEFVELRKNFIVVAVCSTNPDGFVYSWEVNRMWRKTRTNNNDLLCFGVDPNRNWDFGYGGAGTSTDKCSDIYRGTGPFSISETKSFSDYIIAKKAKSYISLHSYSQMFLLSFGCTKQKAAYPEFTDDLKLANDAAKELQKVHSVNYTAGNTKEILYEACGCSSDWAKGTAKVPFSYTIEMRDDGKYGFVLPADQIQPAAEELSAALATMHSTMAIKLRSQKKELIDDKN